MVLLFGVVQMILASQGTSLVEVLGPGILGVAAVQHFHSSRHRPMVGGSTVLFVRVFGSAAAGRSDSTLKSYSLQVVPHGMDTERFAPRPWVVVGTVVVVGTGVGIESEKMTGLTGGAA